MNESSTRRKARPIEHIALALLPASLALATGAAAVEPEKQPNFQPATSVSVSGYLVSGS